MISFDLVEWFHSKLLENPEAMALAQNQGFDEKCINRFNLGYIPEEKRLSFPDFDETGTEVMQVYKYLPGAKQFKYLPAVKGIGMRLYPISAIENTTNVIVGGQKDLVNAAVHWNLPAITSTGGEGSWNSEWNQFFQGHDVIICFDHDDAGRKGAIRVAEQLYGTAASVKIVINQLPYTEDKEDLSDLIHKKNIPVSLFWDIVHKTDKWRPVYSLITLVERRAEDGLTVFERTPYRYTIKEDSGKQTKSVTLTVIDGDDEKFLYRDSINLDKSQPRKKFQVDGFDGSADQDLVTIADMLEKQAKAEFVEATKPRQLYIITKKEIEEAEKYLREQPHILKDVMKVTNSMGLVGEYHNRMILYLIFTSRIMDNPLSAIVKGESGSGKSFTSQAIMNLIPPEGVKFMTRATAQAFFHLEREGLKHKIVYINEQPGSESADYAIRSAQSERDLILMMPVKDPITGDMVTVEKKVEGPCGFLTTTTKNGIFHENETRNISLWTDDTPDQTQRIREIDIQKASGDLYGLTEKQVTEWHNIQRILAQRMSENKYKVRIPFAREILEAFPDNPVRVRRDVGKFIALIESITILHQFHRDSVEEDGQNWLTATIADYHLAKLIGEDAITSSLFQFPKQAEELLAIIRQHYPKEIFTIKDLEKKAKWQKTKVYRFLKYCLNAEIIKEVGGFKHGEAREYQLNGDEQAAGKFMIDANTLKNAYPCDKRLIYFPFNGRL